MSAETLREAAAAIRADYSDRSQAEFENAVADLLDMHAQGLEDMNSRDRFGQGAPYPEVQPNEAFLAVARAYLDAL